jgi:predicted small secreted protein
MKAIQLIAALMAVTVLSSCNTTIGLSRDMRILGESMENRATRIKGGNAGAQSDPYGAPVY